MRRTAGFICRTFGGKLVLELAHKALHRPGTSLAKSADGAAAWNIIGNVQEVLRVLGPALPGGGAAAAPTGRKLLRRIATLIVN